MAYTFTTLRHPVEKLLEAEYFLVQLVRSSDLPLQFNLNAFLSAGRSVTFLLQSALSGVEGFREWYGEQQVAMKSDAAMRFFIELRNISQKQGPVSFVGGARPNGGWTFRFVGRPNAVPQELEGKDIAECCALHIVKLARLLLAYADAFPFASCPARALSPEGMAAIGYGWDDVEEALGLPPGYTTVADIPDREKLRILRREVEPLDIGSIRRLAAGEIRVGTACLWFPPTTGDDLVDTIATLSAHADGGSVHPRQVFMDSIVARMNRIDAERRE